MWSASVATARLGKCLTSISPFYIVHFLKDPINLNDGCNPPRTGCMKLKQVASVTGLALP